MRGQCCCWEASTGSGRGEWQAAAQWADRPKAVAASPLLYTCSCPSLCPVSMRKVAAVLGGKTIVNQPRSSPTSSVRHTIKNIHLKWPKEMPKHSKCQTAVIEKWEQKNEALIDKFVKWLVCEDSKSVNIKSKNWGQTYIFLHAERSARRRISANIVCKYVVLR